MDNIIGIFIGLLIVFFATVVSFFGGGLVGHNLAELWKQLFK